MTTLYIGMKKMIEPRTLLITAYIICPYCHPLIHSHRLAYMVKITRTSLSVWAAPIRLKLLEMIIWHSSNRSYLHSFVS